MGRRKKRGDLRAEEFALHLKIKTKKQNIERLIAQYRDLKEKISEQKTVLRGLLEEHKEVRALLKEEEGYKW